ncbi:thioesterase domain-containing protein [Halotia wernerae UHCC 0503]|nr:thioesterase domain-containing protein [Halotia wernerae UHCC 0503]
MNQIGLPYMMSSIINTPWIEYCQPNPQAKLRLFCFPYAGGSATIFRTWFSNLPNTVEVCPVQIPGRGSRLMEAPFTQILPLVRTLGKTLLPYLDKPYAFFGHSLGALISFELARYFRRQCNSHPVHLFVSARQAPHIPDPSPMHTLPEIELLEELHHLNGTPKEILKNAEMMQLLLPLLQADLAVDETYVYTTEPPLESPITVFGGLQDPETSCDDLEAWHKHTNSSFSIKMFTGDHFFINTIQPLLLQAISQELSNITK